MRWTTEKIREGFERFRSEHGRLPKAAEIDALAYLPSSRLIQTRFGGLEQLRSRLGYADAHFGKGIYRDFPCRLYLVTANTAFTQDKLDAYAGAKHIALPENVELVTLATLASRIARMRAYPDPLAI